MARKIKINILTPSNKNNTVTISNINETASTTTEKILTFARGLIDLTDNTYISTTDETATQLD